MIHTLNNILHPKLISLTSHSSVPKIKPVMISLLYNIILYDEQYKTLSHVYHMHTTILTDICTKHFVKWTTYIHYNIVLYVERSKQCWYCIFHTVLISCIRNCTVQVIQNILQPIGLIQYSYVLNRANPAHLGKSVQFTDAASCCHCKTDDFPILGEYTSIIITCFCPQSVIQWSIINDVILCNGCTLYRSIMDKCDLLYQNRA